MKDEIIIKISLERMNKEIGRINNLIKGLVFDLNKIEGCNVLDYSQIKAMMIKPEGEKQ